MIDDYVSSMLITYTFHVLLNSNVVREIPNIITSQGYTLEKSRLKGVCKLHVLSSTALSCTGILDISHFNKTQP